MTFPLPPLTDHCPYGDCGVDLRGDPIPEEVRQHYGKHTHYGREIVIEIRGVYDGGLFYLCPDCDRFYHRWPPESALYRRAEQQMHIAMRERRRHHLQLLMEVGRDPRRDGPVHVAVSLLAGAPLEGMKEEWVTELLERADLTRPELEAVVSGL